METRLQATDWSALTAAVRGGVSFPGEPGYELATPWNLAKSVRPAAVVSVAEVGDIAHTVAWANTSGLRVTVQRTGHSALDIGDDVVLVNTAALDHVRIDAATRAATFGAGALWSDVINAASEHGLVPVCGSAPHTGVVGLLTGGGVGPLSRALGVASDRVRWMDVVTGDGQLRRASPEEHPDLFWGLRGGKATLGIVTTAEIELVERSEFYGGGAYFSAADLPAVIRAWLPWAESLPEQATTSVCILQLPAAPGVPPPLAGVMTVCVRYVWLGDEEEGRRHGQQILDVAAPVLGGFATTPCAAIGSVHADPVEPIPFREDGMLLDHLTGDAVERLIAAAGPGSGSPLVMTELRQLGGQIRSEPRYADAFCGRRAAYNVMTGGVPLPDPVPVERCVAAVLDALRSCAASGGAAMPNFVVTDDPEAMSGFWDDQTLQRLQDLGDRYDPGHVLHVGQVARRPAPAD